ncbi:MAG: FkbM family methyltransferase [Crocinitomicaceae bacterium]|nr:FkbM family methyltransferase [Crocinitomicaceae bacterium]
MKLIRKILVKVVGIKMYLLIVSKIYINLIRLGFFKSKHPELHFLKSIVRKDDVCVDIGANLGYYSSQLVRIAHQGKVFAVEPIPLFTSIWKKNVKGSNVTLHEVALGNEEKTVRMAIPIRNGVVRHGLTKVIGEDNQDDSFLEFDVQMKVGNELFSALEKLNYLKCDVEGFERFVFRALDDVLVKYKPLIQVELNGTDNRNDVYNQLTGNGFTAYVLKRGGLIPVLKSELSNYTQDFYFVHGDKYADYASIISR